MNEVEKMYENAGINKREIENCTYKNSTPCGHSCDDGEDCPYLEIKNEYPPFTAEKQLELIKWLINEIDYITMWHFNNPKKPYDFDLGRHNSGGETFEDALAQMINNLWQDLTDAEKAQIKNILE